LEDTAGALLASSRAESQNGYAGSGFKTSDQVHGQGVRPIGKAQHPPVCEHLPVSENRCNKTGAMALKFIDPNDKTAVEVDLIG